MLVLTRHKGEAICIDGRTITITVVDIRKDSIKLGVDAPRDMTVHREEIQRLLEEKGEQS